MTGVTDAGANVRRRVSPAVIAVVTLVAVLAVLGSVAAAWGWLGARPDRTPKSAISIQLFSFFEQIELGTEGTPASRLDAVLAGLAEQGYTHVELYDYTDFQGLTPEEVADALASHGLGASGLHTSVSTATSDSAWEKVLEDADEIGAPYVGAGATPEGFTTAAEWIDYAATIDHLGAMARERGMRYVVHSHDWEFAPVDDGEIPYDILRRSTSPENVTFELDLYWAAAAGLDPVEAVTEYRDRISLLHVKDMADDGSIATVGEGTLDFAAVVAAAGEGIDYYVVERDQAGDQADFDLLAASATAIAYLHSLGL